MGMKDSRGLRFSGVASKRPAFWGIHLVDGKNIRIRDVVAQVTNEDREKVTRATYKNVNLENASRLDSE